MNIVDMLLNDPVVIFSFAGLAILLGICAFYVYYFWARISEDEK
ncbi:Protein of unknown function [Colwellia chukchiensis]|uniref:DUF3149 domain-containing protein n=1 Tax=Colwellia chukchiensis TaxID=641665 RepID=A0A1H7R9R1_9GAMM|nr:DUF3149 domain-containing protein [Colwellia chukchiensis]SEL56923.1 Protein of unknown function [Colwellia chukchiensis]